MTYTLVVLKPDQSLTFKDGVLIDSVWLDKGSVYVLYMVKKPWFFTKWFKK